jgi:hypothetical protein
MAKIMEATGEASAFLEGGTEIAIKTARSLPPRTDAHKSVR